MQQFNKALRILFEFKLGSPQDRLLVKYTNIGAYVLTIDDGREQRQLTNEEEWSSVVQRGTTIVMSAVMMVQQTDEKTDEKKLEYKCPFCAFWNWQEEGNGQLIDWWDLTLSSNYHGFLRKSLTKLFLQAMFPYNNG